MGRRLGVALAATVVTAGLAAGGVVLVQHRADVERAEQQAEARAEAERERLADLAAAEQAIEECRQATADYLGAMQDIDAAVSVGVNLEDYADLVRSAAMAQRRLGTTASDCTTGVVEPLDSALVKYSDAATDWNDCVFDDTSSCDVDALDLSPTWADATVLVLQAEEFAAGTAGDPV